MDKKAEAKDALTQLKTFLSKVTGNEEKVEDTVVETELSEVTEEVVEEKVEVAAETSVEESVELSTEEPTYITKEQFEKFQTELTSVISDAISKMNEEKVELSKEVAELSAQPATEAIVHSPESTENKSQGRTYGHKRPVSYMDKCLGKMNQYN